MNGILFNKFFKITLVLLLFCSCRIVASEIDCEILDAKKKSDNSIKIIATSALIPYRFEERKEEYIKSLKTLDSFGYKSRTYIVESGCDSPLSFYEDYCDHVFYANTNNLRLVNKGVNEAKAILKALDHYQFDDEDMIVKITGRYCFDNDQFLKTVQAHPEIDAFARRMLDPSRGITTGCFAMRGKFFKRMFKELDLIKMEEKLIDIEWEAEQFLIKMASENAKVVYLDTVNMTANVNHAEIIHW